MNNFKDIKLEDTNLFLIDNNNYIYNTIKLSNIYSVYDLLTKYEKVINLLDEDTRSNDKAEIFALIKILRYKYLNEELYFNLDSNFLDCKNYKKSITSKLQEYGISSHIGSQYSNKIYAYNLYDKVKVIDIINSILNQNDLDYRDSYSRELLIANKNRTLILKDYYNNKMDR